MKIPVKTQVEKDIDMIWVVSWYKKAGDEVKKGEKVLIGESMKGVADIDSPADGTLAEICVKDDDVIERPPDHKVGPWDAVFALVEDGVAGVSLSVTDTGKLSPESPQNTQIPAEKDEAPPVIKPEDPVKRHAVKAGPHARRIARELGVDLAGMEGLGPRGVITVEQVRQVAGESSPGLPSGGTEKNIETAKPVLIENAGSGYYDLELGIVRKKIAENLALSKECIVSAGCSVRIDFRNILHTREKMRSELVERLGKDAAKYLNLEVIVIEGIIRALQSGSRILNSSFGCGHLGFEGIRVFERINLGIAYDHPAGLMVPVLSDVAGYAVSYKDIADRLADLYERVRTGRLRSSDMAGGTFTFNNSGTLGADDGESVIVHGQSAICTLYCIERGPGSPFYGFGNLGLRFDHRVFDGREAVGFLTSIREFVQSTDYKAHVSQIFK